MAGGGAWKVAYADFVTAMMAFFMVMWLTAQNKAVKESVAQYFENPLGTAKEARATSTKGIPGASAEAPLEGEQAGPHGSSKRGVGADGSDAEADTKGEEVRPEIHIFERLDNTRSRGTMVTFEKYSADLTHDSKLQLAALIPDLLGKPNKIEVRGHSVRGPLPKDSKFSSHWDLCYQRSMNVMNYLIARGIEPDRFRLSEDAEHEPYSREVNEAEDPRNARVEVFAINELAHRFKRTIDQRAGDFLPSDKVEKEAPAGHGDGHGSAPAASGHGGGHGAKPAASGHGGGHGAKPAASGHGGGHGAKPAASGHGGGHGAKPAASGHGGGHGAKPAASGHGAAPAKKSGHGH